MKHIYQLLTFILVFFVFLSLVGTGVALADCTGTSGGSSSGTCELTNPLKGQADTPQQLIGKVINAVLGVVGSLALIMFIYGGFTWMLAAGNSEAVTKGKNILIWATVGLVVIFSSYALVKFVITGIGA